jgi:hypothetical protein
MKITIETTVLEALREALGLSGKTGARFVITDFVCSGPVFEIAFDDTNADDDTFLYQGILFVFEKVYATGLEAPEIIRTETGFGVKSAPCGE